MNAIWALSDFRDDNGATRIVPGSHKFDASPEYGKDYAAVTATMPEGSVMLFDSALWHGGGANNSDARRYAFSCAYCWGWMRQQENLQLGIPRETAARFPRRLQELCGYSVYKGQFGHIDNRDPIELLGRERGKRMVWEATDAKKARITGQYSASHVFRVNWAAALQDAFAPKPQIRRHASLALGLPAIARHGVAVPRLLPVGRTFRQPDKIRRASEMRQRPGAVIVDVADEAEFAAWPDCARHRGHRRILHEAPLPVPPLRPGIGMDQVEARQRARRRPRQQLRGIAGEQADIARYCEPRSAPGFWPSRSHKARSR